MVNAKKGLRLLSFSIILNILWSIVYNILSSVSKQPDTIESLVAFIAHGALITSIVALVCYIIDIFALHIAGKDSTYFHRASFLRIASIVLAAICLILDIVATSNINNESLTAGISITINIIRVVSAIAELLVLTSIIKGCKEISPRVKGMSNFVYVCFFIQIVLTVTLPFLLTSSIINENANLFTLVVILSIVDAIAALFYGIFYTILIFRATANVGKPR